MRNSAAVRIPATESIFPCFANPYLKNGSTLRRSVVPHETDEKQVRLWDSHADQVYDSTRPTENVRKAGT